MSMTWNGYRPGESRSIDMKPTVIDRGHSIIKHTTLLTTTMRWRYSVVCECGKVYTGRIPMTPYDTWSRHKRKELAR